MDLINIILIALIFTSLVVIIGIFGKNLKKFKEAGKSASLREKIRKERSKQGKGPVGFVLAKVLEFFVWLAEAVIRGAKRTLSNLHSGLVELKNKKGVKPKLEVEASQQLVTKKLQTKVTKAEKTKKRKQKEKLLQAAEVSTSTEEQVIKQATKDKHLAAQPSSGLTTEQQAEILMATDKGIKDKLPAEKSKERKLKDFFQKKPSPISESVKQSAQKAATEQPVEQQPQPKKDSLKRQLFTKLNPFKREQSVQLQNHKILTEESFNEFSDGITKIERGLQKQEQTAVMEAATKAQPAAQHSPVTDDEELGIDRKILEKKILQKIAANPRDIEGYRQLGELYIKMRNLEDAQNAYQFILQISARDADASRKLEKIKLLKRLK